MKSRGLSYVTFNPEQVKDVKNTTPTANPDYRFSDRDPDAVKVNQILQKQNAELRETVGYLKELVKLQGKVTDGTVYTRGSVEAAARKLIQGANANGDVVQLQRILEKTYRAMGEGSDSMMGLIDETAQWLVDHKRSEAPKLDGYAQTFSPEEMAEAAINKQRMNVWESFTGLVPIKTVADRNKAQVESVKNRYRTNTGAV